MPLSSHPTPNQLPLERYQLCFANEHCRGCSGSSLNTETCEPTHSGIRQPVSLFIRVLVFSLQGIQTN